jgi:hypothetical protein
MRLFDTTMIALVRMRSSNAKNARFSMPSIIEFFSRESGYMCALDVPDGDGITAAIGKYKKAKLRGGDDKKKGAEVSKAALLLFNSENQPRFVDCDGNALWLPINKTNRDVLVSLLGEDLDAMIGRVITIYRVVGMSFGKQAAMIRIKNRLPAADEARRKKAERKTELNPANDESQSYVPPPPPPEAI